jgi:hypothetical protein
MEVISFITQKINTTNDMCGGVCDVAIQLNVNLIFETIGGLLNDDDQYFAMLLALWRTFTGNANAYGSAYENTEYKKLSDLGHSFILSHKRIEALQYDQLCEVN